MFVFVKNHYSTKCKTILYKYDPKGIKLENFLKV